MDKQNSIDGTKNAEKSKDQKTSYIHAACLRSDKAAWVRESQKRGMKLTEWIVQTLNEKSDSN